MQWPPRALASGFSISPGKSILRTEMESGHARQRRMSASVPERVKAQWRLKGVEVKVWRSWWKHQLLDGSAWFLCELTDGENITIANCRFVAEPTMALEAGRIFTVSGELEVEDLPLMTPAELEAYLAS